MLRLTFWYTERMAKTIQKTYRLPVDVAERLDEKGNVTEYVVAALQEKFLRDEQERFRASARRIAASPSSERDVEFAFSAQAEVADAR